MSRFSSILEQNDVAQVFDLFETYQKNSIYVVGGSIRDALLNREITDIDFATSLKPKTITEILNKENIKFIDVGIDHGTVTAIINERKFEITTFRNDIFTDGRHAQVSFSNSLEEDALRRDFTINAMYLDKGGNLIDPKDGKTDLENRVVRFIGNPDERIKEDYLRLLRYFRFLSRYLDNIDKASMDASILLAKNLNLLSAERLLLEFNKILLSKNAINILDKIIKNDVLTNIFIPVLIDNYQLNKSLLKNILAKLINYKDRLNYPFIIYVSFLITFLEQKETNKNNIISLVIKKFKLSREDKRLLIRNIDWLLNIKKINKITIINLWLDYGELEVMDFKDILIINDISIKNDLKNAFNKPPPKFPISGKDLIKKGLKEGKEVGQVLNHIRDWWILNDCKPSYSECLDKIKNFHN